MGTNMGFTISCSTDPLMLKLWEALEKNISSFPVLHKVYKTCKFNNQNSVKRAETFLEKFQKQKLKEHSNLLAELCRAFTIQTCDYMASSECSTLPAKEKELIKLLKKSFFENPDLAAARKAFCSFHAPRREKVMAHHVVHTSVPDGTIKVVVIGDGHLGGIIDALCKQIQKS